MDLRHLPALHSQALVSLYPEVQDLAHAVLDVFCVNFTEVPEIVLP